MHTDDNSTQPSTTFQQFNSYLSTLSQRPYSVRQTSQLYSYWNMNRDNEATPKPKEKPKTRQPDDPIR